MKKSILAIAALVAVSGAFAHGSSASGSGSNTVTSGSAAVSSASNGGSSSAFASNQGYASTQIQVGGSAGQSSGVSNTNSGWFGANTQTATTNRYGSVEVSGRTETANTTTVQTSTNGPATAGAAAGGVATANVQGSGAFHTIGNGPQGSVNGAANATTATGGVSFGTGANQQNAGMVSNFGASAAADITSTTVRNGTNAFGVFVPTQTVSDKDVKNASTTTYANSISNGGFSGVPTVYNGGTAVGGTINNGSAYGNAQSSVNGTVSVSK